MGLQTAARDIVYALNGDMSLNVGAVKEFLHKYSGVARQVIEALLEKYANDGITEIEKTEVLRLDPFRRMGNPARIAKLFGGKDGYLKAVKELEEEIYKIG